MANALLPRAYLAVDLFFMMSGVVIAHAYDRRLEKDMTVFQFMLARFIRLYPLYLAGSAWLAFLIGRKLLFGMPDPPWTTENFLITFAAGLLMLPSYLGSQSALYPFNPPSWSLMFEMLVNMAYVLAFRWLSIRVLMCLTVAFGIAIAVVGMSGHEFNIGHNWMTFWGGILRVFYSFPLGVLAYRFFIARKGAQLSFVRAPAWLLILVSLAILAMPVPDGWVSLYDASAVLLVFPLIVLAAMDSRPNTRWLGAYAVLGAISYPLYMLHLTFFRLFQKSADAVFGQDVDLLTVPFTTVFLVMAIMMAWLADRLYDRPVRAWLTASATRLLSKRNADNRL